MLGQISGYLGKSKFTMKETSPLRGRFEGPFQFVPFVRHILSDLDAIMTAMLKVNISMCACQA